ncbi:polysaccharide lyase family 7 protein [Zhongshania borealis]
MKIGVTFFLGKMMLLTALFLSACGSPSETRPNEEVLLPADKFDLSTWKITIPTDSDNNGKVDEIGVDEIQVYQHPDFFYLNSEGYMVFAAPNKAFTTPNSTNTRSELHHVIPASAGQPKGIAHNFALKNHKRASDFSQIGGNLQATVMVNHVAKRATYPEKNPAFSVVVGQIHGAKDPALVAAGEGYGWGNEPLKIYYKKWPDHEYGSVFWNYERNLEKDNPARKDISYVVWGKDWGDPVDPGDAGIALDEAFSYEVNVYENTMYLRFSTARHGTVEYQINLADNVDAYGKVDELDYPRGYTGDAHFFKAGAYNQCSIKDDPGFWYPKCLGTGEWEIDKANGDYAQVTFLNLLTGPAKEPKE